MPDFNITTEGIEKLLLNINVSKAIGPDQIPNQNLKLAAPEIAPILQLIFEQSLNTGDLPLDWRRANITPIYKTGSKHHRPSKLQTSIPDQQLLQTTRTHHRQPDHASLYGTQHHCRKPTCFPKGQILRDAVNTDCT
jgi:hypothetical protein